MAKLRHLAFEHGYPTVALVQLLPHRQISKTLGSQKGEQHRARDGSGATILTRLCLAIDSVEDTGASARLPFAFLRSDFCDVCIAFPRRRVRLLGSLTLTLSLSSVCPRSATHHGMASKLKA